MAAMGAFIPPKLALVPLKFRECLYFNTSSYIVLHVLYILIKLFCLLMTFTRISHELSFIYITMALEANHEAEHKKKTRQNKSKRKAK